MRASLMRAALQPICSDFFGSPSKREQASRWNRLVADRAELRAILDASEEIIPVMPRRCVETLLGWFDDIDDGEEVTLGCRAEIEDRIQFMIDCLDELDGDIDREGDVGGHVGLRGRYVSRLSILRAPTEATKRPKICRSQ